MVEHEQKHHNKLQRNIVISNQILMRIIKILNARIQNEDYNYRLIIQTN